MCVCACILLHKYLLLQTTHAGHAKALARDALARGDTDGVVVVGGDGVLLEVVNGLLEAPAKGEEVQAATIRLAAIAGGFSAFSGKVVNG